MDWLHLLEVVGSLITPLVGAYIAWKLARIGANLQERQWRNQAVIQRRLEFYDDVAPKLNDLFCYHFYIGSWKELTPPDVVALKRKLDKQFYVYRHIFDDEVFDRYSEFMKLIFTEFGGDWGTDAQIKADFEKRKGPTRGEWQDEWDAMFHPDLAAPKEEIASSYNAVLRAIRGGLKLQEDQPGAK